MSYTNKIGQNPVLLSNNIEIKSGVLTSGETISDEYRALGYEPSVGTLYISTAGDVFIHSKPGDDANTWKTLVEGDPQPDVETFRANITLIPQVDKVIIKSPLSGSLSLNSQQPIKGFEMGADLSLASTFGL